MNNVQVILDQENLTKENISSVVSIIEDSILAGNLNPLEAYIKAKYLQDIMNNLVKQLKDLTKDEILKYSKEDRKIMGVSFAIRDGYAKYNYETDQEYIKLKTQLKERENLLKDAAKAKEKGQIIMDKNSEIIKAPSVASYTDDSIVISFK